MKRIERVAQLREAATTINGRAIDMDALVDAAGHLYSNIADSAVRNAIRADLRSIGDDGLPWALSVDSHGTYMQTALMSVEEFRYSISQYMVRAQANRGAAFRLADKCKTVHGVWINPDELTVAL